MNYSNSIEGYCQNPLSIDQVRWLKIRVAKGVMTYTIASKLYLAASIISGAAFILTTLLGVLSGLGVFLGFMAVLCVLLLGGACVQGLAAHKGISLKIHGVNMATSETFADYTDAPSDASIASALVKTLMESIRKQERSMLQFEKDLINRLVMI